MPSGEPFPSPMTSSSSTKVMLRPNWRRGPILTAETQLFFGPALRGLDENLLLVRGSASYLLRGFVPLTVPCSGTLILGNFAWRRVFGL